MPGRPLSVCDDVAGGDKCRGPAAGGWRWWPFPSLRGEDGVRVVVYVRCASAPPLMSGRQGAQNHRRVKKDVDSCEDAIQDATDDVTTEERDVSNLFHLRLSVVKMA